MIEAINLKGLITEYSIFCASKKKSAMVSFIFTLLKRVFFRNE